MKPGDSVDNSKQEILARLVSAEVDARHKVDEAISHMHQSIADANAAADQMLADAHLEAAVATQALIRKSQQAAADEVANLRVEADRREAAMQEVAQKNLAAAAKLVVNWVLGEGG